MNGCQCPRGKTRVMKKTGDGEERSMRDLLVLILGSAGLSLSFLFSLSLPIPFFVCCGSSLLICFWSHFFFKLSFARAFRPCLPFLVV